MLHATRLFLSLLPACFGATLDVAMLMQGSDFIDVSAVPNFTVNQYDLGDVWVVECGAGFFSAGQDGSCAPCSRCVAGQYERLPCLKTQNRLCPECTACVDRQYEFCPCGARTDVCYTGNRVCAPLVSRDLNVTFQLSLASSPTAIQEQFLVAGMGAGFVSYLGAYLTHPEDQMRLDLATQQTDVTFLFTYFVLDVYRPEEFAKIQALGGETILQGVRTTFGLAGARRLLLGTNPFSNITVGGVSSACISVGQCPTFFHVQNGSDPCNVTCEYDPCPPGFEGDFGACLACVNGTFKPAPGNGTCTPCPSQYTSPAGATSQDQCQPGPSQTLPETRTTSQMATTAPASVVGTARATTTSLLQQHTTTPAPITIKQTEAPTTTAVNQGGIPPVVAPVATTAAASSSSPTSVQPYYAAYAGGYIPVYIVRDSDGNSWVLLFSMVGLFGVTLVLGRMYLQNLQAILETMRRPRGGGYMELRSRVIRQRLVMPASDRFYS